MYRFEDFAIQSPKRSAHTQQGWDGFFPYYAGYPETFARALLSSARPRLSKKSIVLDPWNGSGTTTYAAGRLGLTSVGLDLNPIMLLVARARILPSSEADSIEPLAREMIKRLKGKESLLETDDPLLSWFNRPTAAFIRTIERRICEHLIGDRTLTIDGLKLENISGLAATFYVALFSLCRQLTDRFRSSNPTWLRKPKKGEVRITASREKIVSILSATVKSMASALAEKAISQDELGNVDLLVADTTKKKMPKASIDLVLTSPPYCTRLDYSAATRIELAVLYPLLKLKMEDLGRRMIGSTRVPDHNIEPQEGWGDICNDFLNQLKRHPSKASDGYYFKTHLDYFEKMASSLTNVSFALKPHAAAILVVQDSFYKDIHNDLPGITVEMAEVAGLSLRRRVDFHLKRSMAGINPHSRTYQRPAGALEAVLCFEKV
jgi:DNA modification methylase